MVFRQENESLLRHANLVYYFVDGDGCGIRKFDVICLLGLLLNEFFALHAFTSSYYIEFLEES